ncbi:MAG: lipid II flippase MurJ [Burkholderiales bacterium]
MFVKAAAVSLTLLLLSRLLGLLRESVMAGAFGTSGLADVVVLMFALPDWFAGLLASGALAFVLLPSWAAQTRQQVASSQRLVARGLLGGGLLLALAWLLAALWQPALLLRLLVPGLPPGLLSFGGQALMWSALAVPLALLAALWSTRLQHERDFTGMYAASLVVNLVLIGTLVFVAASLLQTRWLVLVLGLGLLLAMLLRLVWMVLRLRNQQRLLGAMESTTPVPTARLPGPAIWLWAALSAGLPLTLPFVARSLASQQGEGALAMFNYAWKLVELPLVLAIQLVATLAFPGIVKALDGKTPQLPDAAASTVRGAMALAWGLACACACALLVAAPAIAQLLFGWGKMTPDALASIAQWGRAGAWGLLPQALIAVALTVLAAQARMRAAVAAYALALLALLALGAAGVSQGDRLMVWLNVLYVLVALVCVLAARRGWLHPPSRDRGLWARALLPPVALLLIVDGLARLGAFAGLEKNLWLGFAAGAAAATAVLASSLLASPDVRAALRR